jgi:hypothetical protein
MNLRAVEKGETPAFIDVPRHVGLLDEEHQPIGDRQECTFSWQSGPGPSWQVTINTRHQFDLSALLPKGASYIAIYAENDELMFTLPMVARPKRTGTLNLGV